jgi:molybdopterin-containing oxidoreductase family membrane subunit
MSARDVTGVVGSFVHMDSLIEAIEAVKAAGHEFEVFSPTPRHEIEHAIGARKSPVRYVTFLGALSGLTIAFLLTILSSLVWNLIVGGKPVVSIIPFLVPAFELTILFGGIATLVAILHFGRVPSRASVGYHPTFSDDRFGLFLQLPSERFDEGRSLLEAHHAERCWNVESAQGEED